MGSALRNYAVPDSVVPKSMYDANSVLVAVSDNDPAAVALSASSFIGRKATGDAGAMTADEARELMSGAVVQIQHAQTGAVISGTTVMPLDDTVPQNTEGTEILTCAITPKKATNILLIIGVVQFSHYVGSVNAVLGLFQDTTADALLAAAGCSAYGGTVKPLIHKMVAGTTNETTFKLRGGPESTGTVYINTKAGGTSRCLGGLYATTLTIIEMNP